MNRREKSNQCKFCGKSFFLKSCLVTHELKHKGEEITEDECVNSSIVSVACENEVENCVTLDTDVKICIVADTGEKVEKDIRNDRKPYVCHVCGKQYNLKNTLKTHLIGHNVPKPHFCVLCNKNFATQKYFKLHMQKHEIKKHFTCTVCQREFPSQRLYNRHMNRGHKLPRPRKRDARKTEIEDIDKEESCNDGSQEECFESKSVIAPEHLCMICSEKCSSKCMYDLHIARHKEDLTCVKCEKKFPTFKHLKIHARVHLEKPHVLCEICGKVVRKKTYIPHLRTHTGERPYNCLECGKRFVQKGHLRMHMKHHRGNRSFRCELCGRAFSTKEKLDHHYLLHGKSDVYVCEVCDAKFARWQLLRQHERQAHPEQQFTCQICSEVFAYSSRLYSHYVQHSEEDLEKLDEKTKTLISEKKCFSVKCECCDKYVDKNQMKIHMRLHTGEKPYKCDYCEKSFRLHNGLIIHKRIHTGERPYKCGQCDKTFNQMAHLKTHIALHSAERPYVCKTCGKTFAIQNYLYNHEKIHQRSSNVTVKSFSSNIPMKSYNHKKVHQKNRNISLSNISAKGIRNLPNKGIKVFACFHCGKHFTRKSTHMAHQRICQDLLEVSSIEDSTSESDNYETVETYEYADAINDMTSIECVPDISTGTDNFESVLILKIDEVAPVTG